jgi:hypothetical protein
MAVLLACSCFAFTDDASKFAAQLRGQFSKSDGSCSELEALAAQGSVSPEKALGAGRRFRESLVGLRQVLVTYKGAKTRFGTVEELDLVLDCLRKSISGHAAFSKIVGHPKELSPDEVNDARNDLRNGLKQLATIEVEDRLNAEGLGDLLQVRSFGELKDLTANRVKLEAERWLEKELSRYVKLSVRFDEPLRYHLRQAARSFVAKQVAKLLVKFSPSGLVVETIAGVIVRWVGPKLKEALRNKGDFRERLDRTKAGFETHRERLFALTPESELRSVRRVVESAEGSLGAIKYLEKDLNASKQTALIAELTLAAKRMKGAIHITRNRFLMDSQMARTNLDDSIRYVDKLIRDVDGELAALQPNVRPSQPPRDPGNQGQPTGDFGNAESASGTYVGQCSSPRHTAQIELQVTGSSMRVRILATLSGGSTYTLEGTLPVKEKRMVADLETGATFARIEYEGTVKGSDERSYPVNIPIVKTGGRFRPNGFSVRGWNYSLSQ